MGTAPTSPSVQPGDTFQAEVFVAGLEAADEIVSAFDLTVAFDPAVLEVTTVAMATPPGSPSLQASVIGPGSSSAGVAYPAGRVNLAAASLVRDGQLFAEQPDRVVLATLTLKALAPGTSDLQLLTGEVAGIEGLDVTGAELEDALPVVLAFDQIETATITVPEASAFFASSWALVTLCALLRTRRTGAASGARR